MCRRVLLIRLNCGTHPCKLSGRSTVGTKTPHDGYHRYIRQTKQWVYLFIYGVFSQMDRPVWIWKSRKEREEYEAPSVPPRDKSKGKFSWTKFPYQPPVGVWRSGYHRQWGTRGPRQESVSDLGTLYSWTDKDGTHSRRLPVRNETRRGRQTDSERISTSESEEDKLGGDRERGNCA